VTTGQLDSGQARTQFEDAQKAMQQGDWDKFGKAMAYRLASSIAALPDGPSAHLEHGTIAARLIALLPRQASSKIPSLGTLLGDGAAVHPRVVIYVIIINALIAISMMSAQWIAVSRQPAAQVDDAHAPTLSKVVPQTPPPNSGK
jgi:hypothetical protein